MWNFFCDFIELQSCSQFASAGPDQNTEQVDRLPGGRPQADQTDAAVGGSGATSAPEGQLHSDIQYSHLQGGTTQ